MGTQIASKKALLSVAIATLAIILMMGLMLTAPAQAFASDSSLAVGTQATEKTIKSTKTFQWVKAGKKIYQWGNYNKNIKNGTLRPCEMMTNYIEGWDYQKEAYATVSNLASTNKNVINPKFVAKYGYLKYTSKKAGSAKVTYTLTYTDENGDLITKKVTEKHKVVKYANPLKTFKVGSKDYAKKFKSTPQVNAKSALKGKVSVKAAKGWKIVKIRRVDNGLVSGEFIPQKKLKNGSKVNIKKSGKSALEIICYNKSGKYYESVVLGPNFTYGVVYG